MPPVDEQAEQVPDPEGGHERHDRSLFDVAPHRRVAAPVGLVGTQQPLPAGAQGVARDVALLPGDLARLAGDVARRDLGLPEEVPGRAAQLGRLPLGLRVLVAGQVADSALTCLATFLTSPVT